MLPMLSPNEKRPLVIAIIVLGVVAIALVVWLLLRRPSAPEETVVRPEEVRSPSAVVEEAPASTTTAVTPAEAQAKTVARNFTERFGTYSSDAPYANYDDVRDMATPEFYATLVRSRAESDTYVGVTTSALATTVESGSEASGAVVYRVSVVRETFEGSRANATVEYRAARVAVVERDGVWFVDAFSWADL